MLFFRAAILLCSVRDAQYKTSESPEGTRRELGIINFRKDFWDLYWGLGKHGQYATSMFPMMHLICPPKILHNLCFSFPLGITAAPREIENNACAKLWGANN